MDGITRNDPCPTAFGRLLRSSRQWAGLMSDIFLYLILDVLGSLPQRFPNSFDVFVLSQLESRTSVVDVEARSARVNNFQGRRGVRSSKPVGSNCAAVDAQHTTGCCVSAARLLSAFVSFDPRSRSLG